MRGGCQGGGGPLLLLAVQVFALLCLAQGHKLTPLGGHGKVDRDDGPCNAALKSKQLFNGDTLEDGDTYEFTSSGGDVTCHVVCSRSSSSGANGGKEQAQQQCCKQLVVTLFLGDDDKLRTKLVNKLNADESMTVVPLYDLLGYPEKFPLAASDVVALTNHGSMHESAGVINSIRKAEVKYRKHLAHPTPQQKRMALRPSQVPEDLSGQLQDYMEAMQTDGAWNVQLPQIYLRFDKFGSGQHATVRRRTGSPLKAALNIIFKSKLGEETITVPVAKTYLRKIDTMDGRIDWYAVDYRQLLPQLNLKSGAIVVLFVCNGDDEDVFPIDRKTKKPPAYSEQGGVYVLYRPLGCASYRHVMKHALTLNSRKALYDYLISEQYAVKMLPTSSSSSSSSSSTTTTTTTTTTTITTGGMPSSTGGSGNGLQQAPVDS